MRDLVISAQRRKKEKKTTDVCTRASKCIGNATSMAERDRTELAAGVKKVARNGVRDDQIWVKWKAREANVLVNERTDEWAI